MRLLRDSKSSKRHAPVVYVDCELRIKPIASFALGTTPWTSRQVPWLGPNKQYVRSTQVEFLSYVLNVVSNVVCYVAADLGVLRGVCDMNACQAAKCKPHTLPRPALPRLLVVVDTDSEVFDHGVAQQKFHNDLLEAICALEESHDRQSAMASLEESFYSVQILGLQRKWSTHVRSFVLRRRLMSLSQDAYWSRRIRRHSYNVIHVDALTDLAVSNFCHDRTFFDILQVSRPEGFIYQDLQAHVGEMLKLIPSQSWLWPFAARLVASCLFVSSYPPGAHCKYSMYLYLF